MTRATAGVGPSFSEALYLEELSTSSENRFHFEKKTKLNPMNEFHGLGTKRITLLIVNGTPNRIG